jgi:hypothetical protein
LSADPHVRDDSADLLRSIVDANPYMTLATADELGTPWASPVWFATADYREFIWASKPQARHSLNLALRPELGIVIFDSRQEPGNVDAVYLSARGREVPERELDRCLGIFTAASEQQGLAAWVRADVQAPARLRLYHAAASEHFVLSSMDERVPTRP